MTRRTRQLFATSAVTSLVVMGLASLGASPASAVGVNRFVATTGTDTANTCLVSGAPCRTLGHALAQAAAADTIELSPGTYLASDNASGTANTVPSALHDLTIESNPSGGTAANTIIDATGEANGLLVNASAVTVTHLTIRNADREGIIAGPPDAAAATATISDLSLVDDIVMNQRPVLGAPHGVRLPDSGQRSAAFQPGHRVEPRRQLRGVAHHRDRELGRHRTRGRRR